MKHRIAVLTSGGDCPGMNSLIASLIKITSNDKKFVFFYIKNGFRGLLAQEIVAADYQFALNIQAHSGTAIGTSRLPEFKKPSLQKQAAEILHNFKIKSLIVIGGDGSYQGAKALSDHNIQVITIPGTIDNDVKSSDIAIGTHSTIEYLVQVLDQIRTTIDSHRRCAVVEVMGRNCGFLTLHAGIAANVDIISLIEQPLTIKEICQKVKNYQNRPSVIVLVTEKIYDVALLANIITQKTNREVRHSVIGQVQRGSKPCAWDRYYSFFLAVKALELIKIDSKSYIIGLIKNEVKVYPLVKLTQITIAQNIIQPLTLYQKNNR